MEKEKKSFGVGIVLLVGIVLALSVLAARLPVSGQDSGSWGTLLNEYLAIVHDSGGSLKGSVVGSSQISDIGIQAIDINVSVVNATHIVDFTITNADIAFAGINQSVIALNAINTSQIVDFTITNADIAFAGINQSVIALNAINTSQIVDFTITNADIAFAGINQSVIAPNSVNTTQIVVGGLTGNAIASDVINATHLTEVSRLLFGACNVDLPQLTVANGGVNNTANAGNPPFANCTVSSAAAGDRVIVTPNSLLPANVSLSSANITVGSNITLGFTYAGQDFANTDAGTFSFSYIVFVNSTG